MTETLPRRFGSYVLTAALGEDALGKVYRALRLDPDRGFVRLRILETEEISEDAVLDAIQENGEIHSHLKNPAIARGVTMDSVEGVPFLAWEEENGRTLNALLARAPTLQGRIPIEHSLLIAEKIATALDHAYNTTIEGERTLHGLVWPGFVSLSDDGETCLTGFGLAPGLLASRGRPRFSKEIGPYLAPEERSEGKIGKNSDVFSVGVILFELLTGRLPAAAGPVADLFTVARGPSPLPPELTAVLKTCLSDAASRYQSSGELRRELGKLLFSGPYSPSTFNLAYFLNNLFGPEIEAEGRAREREAALDLGSIPASLSPQPSSAQAPSSKAAPTKTQPLPVKPAPSPAKPPEPSPPSKGVTPTTAPKFLAEPEPRRKAPLAVVGVLLLAAAAGGTWFVISKRQAPLPPPLPTPLPTLSPEPTATPESSPSTAAMSALQFKAEVSRRLAEEVKRLEEEAAKRREDAETARIAARAATAAAIPPTPTPTAVVVAQPPPEPTEPPPPTATPLPVQETPPAMLKILKPVYPPVALKARIGGLVILRVLVSETGQPLQVEVLRGAPAGLTEAAVAAVRKWTFTPARRGDTPVSAWMTVPIPFEP
ncbi:MAG TPA: TonB family protein [Thermoanaerobaculia bacterium]|nr:TonB family protein [Thermoanaerobaculia bacterium]